MNLLIVESPAKCKTIKKYLGNNFDVIASFGHIRELPSKNGSIDHEQGFEMHYEVSADKKKHVKNIVDHVKKTDNVYLATDPDREGEAISWHVYEVLKNKKLLKKDLKIFRISFNQITKSAIKNALDNPRELDINLINAQQARLALDYLVGFNLSPVLWRKLPGSRSAGRVQSVALRLICDREVEIENFITQEYWQITGNFDKAKASFSAKLNTYKGDKLERFSIPDQQQAESIVDDIKNQKYIVKDISKKQVKRSPYPPFTTSSLQQEASRKLGFGAKKTMMVAQKLYEGINIGNEEVGLITYMRTDGINVAQEAVNGAREFISKDFGAKYLPSKQRHYNKKAKNSQEAHEAIRPTVISYTPDKIAKYLEKDHLRLYELIWKRMVASQMENALFDQVAVDITAENDLATFRAVGTTIAFDGFLKLYIEGQDDADEEDDKKLLPPFKLNQTVKLDELLPTQHFTQPPPRYSEASLVKKMEELGIGRPSTYANIISVLQDRSYVRLDKKRFIPEERGRLVTTFLANYFSRYIEYDFTANLENRLDDVSAGNTDWKIVLQEFWIDFIENIDSIKDVEIADILSKLQKDLEKHLFDVKEDGTIDKLCNMCKEANMGLRLGKFGAFLACENYPKCKNTKQIGDNSNGSSGIDEDVTIGNHPETDEEITLKKGPYGFYVQQGEASKEKKKKAKRASIPKDIDHNNLDLETALQLLSLPRIVGIHPETGQDITTNYGRFGPYVKHEDMFASIKNASPLTIDLEHALQAIADKKSKSTASEPIKNLGKHPDMKQEIKIFEGKYGPYIKLGRKNIKIPKDIKVEKITLNQAVEIIANNQKK
ncbi:MAG: type I DNA topoisomerase [Pseudomonadota bacterium]